MIDLGITHVDEEQVESVLSGHQIEAGDTVEFTIDGFTPLPEALGLAESVISRRMVGSGQVHVKVRRSYASFVGLLWRVLRESVATWWADRFVRQRSSMVTTWPTAD